MDKNKPETNGKKIKEIDVSGMMMSDLLSAISETEYPAHIIEAAEIVRKWMHDAINKHEDQDEFMNTFADFTENDFEEDYIGSVQDLYSRLKSIEEFADVIPNSKKSGDKSDTIIISIDSPNYEGGLRAAIDHAAIFNRGKIKRVWIISDNFVFGEIVRFIPHVDALAEQGISLRFLLITPWGWTELPLSEAGVSKQQFLWRNDSEQQNQQTRPTQQKRGRKQ